MATERARREKAVVKARAALNKVQPVDERLAEPIEAERAAIEKRAGADDAPVEMLTAALRRRSSDEEHRGARSISTTNRERRVGVCHA